MQADMNLSVIPQGTRLHDILTIRAILWNLARMSRVVKTSKVIHRRVFDSEEIRPGRIRDALSRFVYPISEYERASEYTPTTLSIVKGIIAERGVFEWIVNSDEAYRVTVPKVDDFKRIIEDASISGSFENGVMERYLDRVLRLMYLIGRDVLGLRKRTPREAIEPVARISDVFPEVLQAAAYGVGESLAGRQISVTWDWKNDLDTFEDITADQLESLINSFFFTLTEELKQDISPDLYADLAGVIFASILFASLDYEVSSLVGRMARKVVFSKDFLERYGIASVKLVEMPLSLGDLACFSRVVEIRSDENEAFAKLREYIENQYRAGVGRGDYTAAVMFAISDTLLSGPKERLVPVVLALDECGVDMRVIAPPEDGERPVVVDRFLDAADALYLMTNIRGKPNSPVDRLRFYDDRTGQVMLAERTKGFADEISEPISAGDLFEELKHDPDNYDEDTGELKASRLIEPEDVIKIEPGRPEEVEEQG